MHVNNPSYITKSFENIYLCKKHALSYDVASGSEITPCNRIDKPLVVYRFTGNVMTSITTLRHNDKIIKFYARNQISKYLSYDK